MSQSGGDRDLRELVECVVNGAASVEQSARLERLLLESESARDQYLDYVNLHSALRQRFLASAEKDEGGEIAAELADLRRALAVESFPARRPWRKSTWVTITAVLAMATASFAIYQFGVGGSGDVATIRVIEGEATLNSAAESQDAKVGDAMRSGDTLRVGSDAARVMLEYPDGTQVCVHSESVVQAPADRDVRLELLAGSLEVAAVKQPRHRPLIFATKHSRYLVLGTRFRLYHDPDASRLELDEGQVRMQRPGRGETIDVQAGSVAIAADEQTAVQILPLSMGRAELNQNLSRAGQKVEFTPDDQWLVSGNWETGLKRWRLDDKDEMTVDHEHRADAGWSDGLAIAPDGQTIVQVNRHGYLLAWRPGDTASVKLPLTGRHARSRAISPDGLAAAESSDDGTIVYGIDMPSEQRSENSSARISAQLSQWLRVVGPGKAWCLALSRRGESLAAGFWDGTVRVYAVPSGDVVWERKLSHMPTHLDLTADGKLLAVYTQRDGLKLFDLNSRVQQSLWPAGSDRVRCLRFSPDGRRVLAGLNDRTARMWRVEDGRQLLVIDAGHAPQGIAWSESRGLLATADGTVKLWKCRFDVASTSSRNATGK